MHLRKENRNERKHAAKKMGYQQANNNGAKYSKEFNILCMSRPKVAKTKNSATLVAPKPQRRQKSRLEGCSNLNSWHHEAYKNDFAFRRGCLRGCAKEKKCLARSN